MTIVWGEKPTAKKSKTKEYINVRSVAEYVRKLENIEEQNHLLFRGLSDENYELVPSLDRNIDNEKTNNKWIMFEHKLVEFAEQRFPESFVKQTPSLLIANMQHFGIPTRMMDVTGNALVALYFACANDRKNGQVIVFDEKTVSAYNPYANIIADTYRITQNSKMNSEIYRYLIYSQPYSASLIYPDWEKKKNSTIDNNNFSIISRPLVVDVGAVNQRQINQDGKFILFPNRLHEVPGMIKGIGSELVKIDKRSDFVKAIINIPKEYKNTIIKQLGIMGIKKEFLFPDDIEVVCNGIKQVIQKEGI